MKLVSVRWTPIVNLGTVECSCGARWDIRLDRYSVKCPKCGSITNIVLLRNNYWPEDESAKLQPHNLE